MPEVDTEPLHRPEAARAVSEHLDEGPRGLAMLKRDPWMDEERVAGLRRRDDLVAVVARDGRAALDATHVAVVGQRQGAGCASGGALEL